MLSSLPDHARVWLFATDRPLDHDARVELLADVEAFAATWASHGRPVRAAAAWVHDRVLAVGADLPGGVSGCGIDGMTRAVEVAAEMHGTTWLGGMDVAYRDRAGALHVVPRAAFRALARTGAVSGATPVLDLTTDSVDTLRRVDVERPAAETWHGIAFGLAAQTAAVTE